jgi:hypothetical protein
VAGGTAAAALGAGCVANPSQVGELHARLMAEEEREEEEE